MTSKEEPTGTPGEDRLETQMNAVEEMLDVSLRDMDEKRLSWWVSPLRYEFAPPSSEPDRRGWPVRATKLWTQHWLRSDATDDDTRDLMMVASKLNAGQQHPSMDIRVLPTRRTKERVHTAQMVDWSVAYAQDAEGVVLLANLPISGDDATDLELPGRA